MPFIYKYDWKGTNYLSGKDDRKTFEKNNPKIVLNVLKHLGNFYCLNCFHSFRTKNKL